MKNLSALLSGCIVFGIALLSPKASHGRDLRATDTQISFGNVFISYDTSFQERLYVANPKCYQFSASQGDVVTIRVLREETSISVLKVELFKLNDLDNIIASDSINGPENLVNITNTLDRGDYQIIVKTAKPTEERFGFSLQKLNQHSALPFLEYGENIVGSRWPGGQVKAYHFFGRENDRIHIRLKVKGFIQPMLELYGPSGREIIPSLYGGAEVVLRMDPTLADSGFYTLFISNLCFEQSSGDAFGLNLQKLDPVDSANMAMDSAVSLRFEYLGQTLLYTFEASGKDYLSVNIGTKGDFLFQVEIYDPKNNRLETLNEHSHQFDQRLTVTGNYKLLVMETNGRMIGPPERLGISVHRRNNAKRPALILRDTLLPVQRFTQPGENHAFTFFGKTGDRINLDVYDNDDVWLEVFDPDGMSLMQTLEESGQLTIIKSGIYTIFVRDRSYLPTDLSPANYSLQISGLGEPIPIDLKPTICEEETFEFHGYEFGKDCLIGYIAVPAVITGDPDTVYQISLDFYPKAIEYLTDTLCLGRDTLIAGALFNSSHPRDSIILDNADQFGCDLTLVVNLFFDPACPSVDFFIPKVFTPNNDGVNDEFVIPFIRDDPSRYSPSHLLILDRSKRPVFESSDYHRDGKLWDGRDMHTGEPVAVGTYYYSLLLPDNSQRNGLVSLLR